MCGMCMCLARGERGWVHERIGFGLYQSCGNRGSVGRVSVGEWVGGVDQGLEGLCYVCVRCESGLSV